jgi:hypothetical protein
MELTAIRRVTNPVQVFVGWFFARCAVSRPMLGVLTGIAITLSLGACDSTTGGGTGAGCEPCYAGNGGCLSDYMFPPTYSAVQGCKDGCLEIIEVCSPDAFCSYNSAAGGLGCVQLPETYPETAAVGDFCRLPGAFSCDGGGCGGGVIQCSLSYQWELAEYCDAGSHCALSPPESATIGYCAAGCAESGGR